MFFFSAEVQVPLTKSGRVSLPEKVPAGTPSHQNYLDKIDELRDEVKFVNSEKADLQEKVNDLVEKLEEKHYHNMLCMITQ